MGYNDRVPFETLKGKILTSIDRDQNSGGNDRLVFNTEDGESFEMTHSQDCCESVNLEDVCGDLSDLIGSEILLAEEVSNDKEMPEDYQNKIASGEAYQPDSFTWTFYKLATIKGHVTLRWLGTSNGYYSERVEFEKLTDYKE